MQEKVDRLKFQILLKEKDIQYHSSKNVTLGKQNAGLKQEVRKLESEMNKKNAAIHALKEQINYFKEQSSHCDNLKREINQLKNKIEDLRPYVIIIMYTFCTFHYIYINVLCILEYKYYYMPLSVMLVKWLEKLKILKRLLCIFLL